MEAELNRKKVLGMIKKLVYTGGTNDLNKSHNRAIAHLNLMNLDQDRFQDIQELCDQYIATKKVCSEMRLRFGRCKGMHSGNTGGQGHSQTYPTRHQQDMKQTR